jgi:nicotinate-nucleotide adenylyltransferase
MNGKIGLFGGSFDPVHTAHAIIASIVKQEFCLDKIIFMPNYLSPFKTGTTVASAEQRLAMLNLALQKDSGFEVSDYEISMNRPVYTYETLKYLKEKYPSSQIYLILGMDSYLSITKWKNYSEIIEKSEIIVVERKTCGSFSSSGFSGKVKFSELCPAIDISSTMIRKMIAANLDIKYLVNEEVCRYINDVKLYN